jgi:hypothetical protein
MNWRAALTSATASGRARASRCAAQRPARQPAGSIHLLERGCGQLDRSVEVSVANCSLGL